MMREFVPVDPGAADVQVGLARSCDASTAASTTAESKSALVASPELALWMAPSVLVSRRTRAGVS